MSLFIHSMTSWESTPWSPQSSQTSSLQAILVPRERTHSSRIQDGKRTL